MSSNLELFANRNPLKYRKGFLSDRKIGEGKYKEVYKGTYDPNGDSLWAELAADKYLKSGTTFSSDCFLDDVRAAEAALPFCCWLPQTAGDLAGQKVLREPFIAHFQKFNSNSGAADVTATVAQALSHYSYHASDGTELLCDLQGGKVGDSYVLSDVVIMSMSKKFGNTDLGATGIENWLNAHRCNHFCSPSWKNWTGARHLIKPVFSTTTTLDAFTAPAAWQEYIRVRPSQIHFTHDSIKNSFQDGNSLIQTTLQIAREEVGKRDIPMISVVRVNDGRFFSLDNRRLAVFRLLEICGRVGTIKVQVVPYSRWQGEWSRKVTTKNGGDRVHIRGGRYYIGKTEQDTCWPWLDQIRRVRPRQTMANDEFRVFLAGFTDE